MEEEVKKRSSKWVWIAIIIVVVALGLMWWSGELQTIIGVGGPYKAVFLTNDQVYFGKLSNADSKYATLRDVYYLQVTQPLQPIDQGSQQPNLNLVKLGGELHGPTDEMMINRDHILFIEDMRDDSQVATAIRQSKEAAPAQ